ncbi:MAG: DUF1328 domain-containing protein [Bacteroidota bacterium]|nr:DUF1328 domain-containing protein [Bacteroidota bacterium]
MGGSPDGVKAILVKINAPDHFIAIIAGVFGFFGIAAGAASIAKILFFIFIVLFLVSLIGGRSWGRRSNLP